MARKMIDIQCEKCGAIQEDRYVDLAEMDLHDCGGMWERVLLRHAAAVHGDDIPGGYEVRHALCHADGTPQKFYTKSAMRQEAKRRGWTNHVEHKPLQGSDRSPHTTRWV